MWIAKNSITGQTYGKKFDSVYDRQSFIDKELVVLEYEMRRCFSLERDVLDKIKNECKSLFDILKDAFDEFSKESGLQQDVRLICEMSLKGKKQEEIDKALFDLSMSRWQKNNIIRCYNTSQNRFANGFDF